MIFTDNLFFNDFIYHFVNSRYVFTTHFKNMKMKTEHKLQNYIQQYIILFMSPKNKYNLKLNLVHKKHTHLLIPDYLEKYYQHSTFWQKKEEVNPPLLNLKNQSSHLRGNEDTFFCAPSLPQL